MYIYFRRRLFNLLDPFQDIDRHPYLDSIGFVVNNVISALICEPCKWAIKPGQVQGHMNDTHHEAGVHIDADQLQEALELLDVSETLPEAPKGQIFPEIVGLAIQEGFQCHHCDKAQGASSSMEKHHRQHHLDQPLPNAWPKCYLQHITTRPCFKFNLEANRDQHGWIP
jgi:hypothetical protein